MNLIISASQQRANVCKMKDTEQDHCHIIAEKLFRILRNDITMNVYMIPKMLPFQNEIPSKEFDNRRLTKAIDMSNELIKMNGGAGYHLAIHTDAGGYKKGCSGLYYSMKGKQFAEYIAGGMAALTPTTDGQLTYYRDNLSELKRTVAIAALIELSFHDEEIQAAWIHENLNEIAVRLADSIYRFKTDLKIF